MQGEIDSWQVVTYIYRWTSLSAVFLSANSVFDVQNNETYLPRIARQPVFRKSHFQDFSFKTGHFRLFSCTGEPRYPRSFYLRIHLFTFEILLKMAKFPVKMCLFVCEFSIRGPKWQDVSTANNEAQLYIISHNTKTRTVCLGIIF